MGSCFINLMLLAFVSLSIQFDEYFTPHVLMVRNRLTYKYLSVFNDSVSSSSTYSSPSNLILYDSGTDRYLKKYSDTDQDQWVEWIAVEEECEQEITLSSTHSKFYTSPEGEIRGVRVYTQDDDTLEKYYLKMDVLTYEVTLECEEAYLNSSMLIRKQFLFDLLGVPESIILGN